MTDASTRPPLRSGPCGVRKLLTAPPAENFSDRVLASVTRTASSTPRRMHGERTPREKRGVLTMSRTADVTGDFDTAARAAVAAAALRVREHALRQVTAGTAPGSVDI